MRTKAPASKRRKSATGSSAIAVLADAPIEQVWRVYKKSATDELRNHLIENYLHLVKSTAERMHMRLPGEVDVEDAPPLVDRVVGDAGGRPGDAGVTQLTAMSWPASSLPSDLVSAITPALAAE